MDKQTLPENICPFMSTVFLLQTQSAGLIEKPGQVGLQPVPGYTQCIKEKCTCWNKRGEGCGFRDLWNDKKTKSEPIK